MSKTADRLAALVATVEWLGTYAGDTLTLAEGATVADGIPADMVAAYELAVDQLEAHRTRIAAAARTKAFRAAVRQRIIELGMTPTADVVNKMAAEAMKARDDLSAKAAE